MNQQNFKPHQLIDLALQIAREKSKIDITEEKLFAIIRKGNIKDKLVENRDSAVWLDELDYEEFNRCILSSLGYVSSYTDSCSFIFSLQNKYGNFNDNQIKILEDFVKYLESKKETNKLYFDEYIDKIIMNYNICYLSFALDVINAFIDFIISSPYYNKSKYEGVAPIALNDLYKLEKNNSQIGEFFDVRYIEYLYANFEDLNHICWRKFEQLSAQFFTNYGYKVELGKGRKDGGTDIIATKGKEIIIVQCKRWKNKVGVEQIKAFKADMDYYNVSGGILFCSTGVSRDSIKLIVDRKYNIKVFNQYNIFNELVRLKFKSNLDSL